MAPRIARAASGAGRPAPRVAAILAACVTQDSDGARRTFAERWTAAGQLPSYRALLNRQGLAGVPETAVAGDDAAVRAALRRYADAGATELVVSPFGTGPEQSRTLEAFAALREGV